MSNIYNILSTFILLSTWKNAQLGEKVIMQLEQNSKQIAQEKQDYIDKLNDAASKLESELEKKQVSYP